MGADCFEALGETASRKLFDCGRVPVDEAIIQRVATIIEDMAHRSSNRCRSSFSIGWHCRGKI
jgi:hypothetical protein